MELAETIVYLSVWAALLCYPAAGIGRAAVRPAARRWARRVWTAGCLFFGIHVVSAFGVFYGWSHSVALVETARQTLAATGFESGSGLYLNYLFALLWLADAAWWWLWPESYQARSLAGFLGLHGFFLFMIINGSVVFVDGPRRGLGVLVSTAGAATVGWAVVLGSKRGGD